jgi:hypothetical protein
MLLYLAYLLFVLALILSIPQLKSWLMDKRLVISSKRVFKYVATTRRSKCLDNLVKDAGAIVYIPGVGAVFNPDSFNNPRATVLWYYDRLKPFKSIFDTVEFYKEEFRHLEIHSSVACPESLFGHITYRFIALLVNEDSQVAITSLCKELDKYLIQNAFKSF